MAVFFCRKPMARAPLPLLLQQIMSEANTLYLLFSHIIFTSLFIALYFLHFILLTDNLLKRSNVMNER